MTRLEYVNAARNQIVSRRRLDASTGCWIWTGPTDHNGYGILSQNGSIDPAHRVSWDLYYPDSPCRLGNVRRSCKCKACINPEHLYVTRTDWRAAGNPCLRGHQVLGTNAYIWLTPYGREVTACRQCRHFRLPIVAP